MNRLMLLIYVLMMPDYGIAQNSDTVSKGTITISKKGKPTEAIKINEDKDTILTAPDRDFFGSTPRNVALYARMDGVYTEQYDQVVSFTCSIPKAGIYVTYASSNNLLTPTMCRRLIQIDKSNYKVEFAQIKAVLRTEKQLSYAVLPWT